MYLEIRGDKGYCRWDARYEILLGSLLEPPVIVKEALFAPINALRAALHQPVPETVKADNDDPCCAIASGVVSTRSGKTGIYEARFFLCSPRERFSLLDPVGRQRNKPRLDFQRD